MPQGLPFANRIKSRALISLVQQGLRYYHLAKTIDQARKLVEHLLTYDPSFAKLELTEWTAIQTT